MKPQAFSARPALARRSPVNLAFSAILFSLLGWAILERWYLGARTGAVPHLVTTLACAPVMACSLRRFHAACPRHLRAASAPPGIHLADGLALAFLFGVGAVFGLAVASGSMLMIALPAAACCLMPWTALRVHQQHLLLSLLAAAAGAALAPGFSGPEPSLLVVLPAVWCLWAVAAVLCIGLCGAELMKRRALR
jgi:hypothetical protein